MKPYTVPEYHTKERQWYLWNGHEAILDEHGAIRLFLTAQDAYDYLTQTHRSTDEEVPHTSSSDTSSS